MKRTIRIAGHITIVSLILLIFLRDFSGSMEHPIRAVIALVVLSLMGMGMWDSVFDRKAPPAPPELPKLSGNFGTASYAPETTSLNPAALSSGVFFGKSSAPENPSGNGAPICSRPENHTLIVAKTRTGKGTRIIVPTLLRAWRTSAFVIDPKGENASITARARALTSHVHVMNPWGELGDTYQRLGFPPATYNPLDILDRNDPNVVSIAQTMGKTMCPSEGQKEPFWSDSAADLISATLLWLTEQPGEQKTLSRLADILSMSRKSLREKYLGRMAASEAFGGAIRKASARFIDMPDVTYGGIMGHVAQAIAFLNDPQILAATSKSSFSMTDLTGFGKDRPTTLYLVVPWDKVDIQKVWLRLMITAGMHTFRRKPAGSRYRCLFMIDEFPALGRLDDMPREIAGMSGAGVDFALVVQGISKLKDIYGDAHADIVGNCSYKWFCNINDYPSAEFLSKTLGNKTVQTTNTGENRGSSFSGGMQGHWSTSEGENTSKGETGVPLLRPEDALNLGTGAAILLAPGSRAHYLQPIDYWNLQGAFGMHPDAYPHLYFDRNACLAPDRPQCEPQPPPVLPSGTPPSAVWETAAPVYSPGPETVPRKPLLKQLADWIRPRKKNRIDLTKYRSDRPQAQTHQNDGPTLIAPAAEPSKYDATRYAPAATKGTGSDPGPPASAPKKRKPYDWGRYSSQRVAERDAKKPKGNGPA